MGLLDDAKGKATETAAKIDEKTGGKLTEAGHKATEMAGKAQQAAGKAIGSLDERTGGKVTEATHKATEMAEKAKEKLPTDKIPGMEKKQSDTGESEPGTDGA